MRRHLRMLIASVLFCLPFLHGKIQATVYLNRVLVDPENKIWVLQDLKLVGTGLTVNRQYQNDYGKAFDLLPGPPFIVEGQIQIYNTESSQAIFIVDANGMGAPFGDPFEIKFETVSPNALHIDVGGSVVFRGTMTDPIELGGSYRFLKNAPQYGFYSDSTDICEFTQCVFTPSPWIRLLGPPVFEFHYGQTSFDHCTFSGFDQTNMILFVDETSQGLPTPTTFRMTTCAVKNGTFGPEAIYLKGVHVTLENNWFEANSLSSVPAYYESLVRMDKVALDRITGNVALANTVNKLWVSDGGGWVFGTTQIQTSEDLPLVISALYVEPSGDLRISPGSVIKFGGVLQVKGEATIEGSVLTSSQDDAHGGDTDLLPPSSLPPVWDSLSVWKGASLTMAGTLMLYCRSGIRAYGALTLDSCTIQWCSGGAGAWLLPIEDLVYRISKCLIRESVNGVIIRPGAGHGCEVWLEGDSLIHNASHGVLLDLPVSGETRLVLRNCRIAGNGLHGIDILGSPFLKSIQVRDCRLEANGWCGLSINNTSGSPDVSIASNVISGNGYVTGTKAGVLISSGKFHCSNNTFAHNAVAGLRVASVVKESCHVDNNLFYRNGYYGYWGPLPGSLAFNHFFGNTLKELSASTSGGTIQTVDDLRALGGDYATNQGDEPRLETPVQGIVRAVSYDSRTDQSTLVATTTNFDGLVQKGVIIQPEKSQNKWYASVGGHADTLIVAGALDATVLPGDTLELFDYRLAQGSPLIDRGSNEKVISLSDVDGNSRILDGDRDNDKTVDIGAFEFGAEGLPPNPLTIGAPAGSTFWLAGEPHEITWSTSGVPNVNLYYHLDYTSSNRSAWKRIARSISSSLGKYSWTPADTLISAKCKVMVADASDTTVNVKSDFFRMKPYVLTRLTADGSYETYHPAIHGWSFENSDGKMWPQSWWSQFDYVTGIDPYTLQRYPPYFSAVQGTGALGAKPFHFPDWPLFVWAFGKPACYYTIQSANIYKPSALLKWGAIKDTTWGGACAGFAVSSFLAFDRKSSFQATYPDVGDFDRLSSLAVASGNRKVINGLWLFCYGTAQLAHADTAAVRTPRQTLNDLRAMFLKEPGDNAYMVILDPDSGCHALSPYRVRQDPQYPDLYRIFIYDSNFPADTTLQVVIDTAANTWVYSDAQGWNVAFGCYLSLPASAHLVPPSPDFAIPPPPASLAKRTADLSNVNFFVSRSASVALSNSLGQTIGFPRLAVPATIPGARPIILPAGNPSPPVGYRVPPGQYSARLWAFTGPEVKLSIFSKSLLFGYDRSDGSPDQTDRLEIGDHLSITNPDTAAKLTRFQIIAPEDTAEKAYYVANLMMLQNDSLALKLGAAGELQIANVGAGKTYDLRIVGASAARAGEFLKNSIALGPNTSHLIKPSWPSIDTSLLRILVDRGNDGIYEDTLLLRNDATGVLLQGSLIPNEFELSPCYPNPFNPATVVGYRLPVASDVKLVIYDLLGREVAVLVNERKAPGVYEVRFDAKGLASGVYLCRLEAGKFTQTRKMVLVR